MVLSTELAQMAADDEMGYTLLKEYGAPGSLGNTAAAVAAVAEVPCGAAAVGDVASGAAAVGEVASATAAVEEVASAAASVEEAASVAAAVEEAASVVAAAAAASPARGWPGEFSTSIKEEIYLKEQEIKIKNAI